MTSFYFLVEQENSEYHIHKLSAIDSGPFEANNVKSNKSVIEMQDGSVERVSTSRQALTSKTRSTKEGDKILTSGQELA